MTPTVRRALPTTFRLATFELVVNAAVGVALTSRVLIRTGGTEDPVRLASALDEWWTRGAPPSLPSALTPALAIVLAYALTEPYLHVVFVRAHGYEDPASRPLRRVATLVGARALALLGALPALAILGLVGAVIHVATNHLTDPRPHDLLLVALGLLGVLVAAASLLLAELAGILVASGPPSVLSGLGGAIRLINLRLGTLRVATALASNAVLLTTAAVASRAGPALAATATLTGTAFAWLVRSAYVVHVLRVRAASEA